MAFLIGGANSESAAYEIDNSLRFEEASEEYLYWLPTSNPTGGGQTFTFSFWYKPTASYATNQTLFGNADDDSDTRYGQIRHRTGASGALEFSFGDNNDGGWKFDLETSALLRDPSAWYHIICQSDTTNGTEGDRIKIYINGERVTSFGTENYPAQNYVSDFGANDIEQTVGGTRDTEGNFSAPFSGYLSDVYFIDGQALTPTDFGKTNTNGVWIPKKYGGSFGTNGYKLEFQQTGTSANSSGMGADTSGNDHHFTVVALDATSVTTDTPTNNFATLNPLITPFSQTNYTLSEGNLKYVTGLNQPAGVSTMAMTNGKWYWEIKKGSTVDNPAFGIVGANYGGVQGGTDYGDADSTVIQTNKTGEGGDRIGYSNNGSDVYKNSTDLNYGSFDSIASGDIFMVALDMDNNKIWFGNNGTWLGSGDPANGSNNVTTITAGSSQLAAVDSPAGGNVDWEINFGNPTFSISSGNADDNGYGNFEYDVPSGFYALCSKNLGEFGG